jgi:hypothetical protein
MGEAHFYTDDIELATWLVCKGERVVDLKVSTQRRDVALLGFEKSADMPAYLMSWKDRESAISVDPRVFAQKRRAIMRWVKSEVAVR